MELSQKNKDELNEIIKQAEAENKICFMDYDGNLHSCNIKDFMKQPLDGMLYDLNRSPEVLMTIMDLKFVNDYGMMLLVRELYKENQKLKSSK